MSGAEKLTEKILTAATAEAEALLAGARERAAATQKEAAAAAAAQRQEKAAAVDKKVAELQRRDQVIAELDARKEILAAKESLLDEVFTKAVRRLQELPAAEYQELLLQLLLAAAQGTEEIIISPDDRKYFAADFLARTNRALRAAGKAGQLTLAAETRPLQGGFVLSAGNVEINSSFAALLRRQREQLEPTVAALLFAEA